MNREIKFRAWLKYGKEIVDVEEIDFMNEVINYIDNDYENNEQEIIGAYFENIELMQYTELKDKNNKEIYEGDIVKFLNGIFEVIWCNEKASFMLKNKEYKEFLNFIYENHNVMEIVGNIYKNPELIKEWDNEILKNKSNR